MRSVSCQSGPCSRTATFLPAFARTAAKTDPDAPAPTMTTSTFSLAMSPPLGRRYLAHIVDEAALLRLRELGKSAAIVERLAGAIDRAERGAIEIRIGRPDVEDA